MYLGCKGTLCTGMFTNVVLSCCSFLSLFSCCFLVVLSYWSSLLFILIFHSFCFCPCLAISFHCIEPLFLCLHCSLFIVFVSFDIFAQPPKQRRTYKKIRRREKQTAYVIKSMKKRCVGHNGFCFVFLKKTKEKTKQKVADLFML